MKQKTIIRVFVVEDEPAILKNIIKKIEDADPDFKVVETAINGQEALKKIFRESPDIVFTDIRMPVMNGLELLGYLRGSFQDLPVVLVSGYSDFEYMKQAISFSAQEYLLKPVRAEEMKELLARIKVRILQTIRKEKKNILTSQINMEDSDIRLPYFMEKEKFMLFLVCGGNLLDQLSDAKSRAVFEKIWSGVHWEQIVCDVVSEYGEWWVIDENICNQKFILIATDTIRINPVKCAEKLLTDIKKYFIPYDVSVAVYPEYIEYGQIGETSHKLREVMEGRKEIYRSQILVYAQNEKKKERMITEREFLAVCDMDDFAKLKRYMEKLFGIWEEQNIPQRIFQQAIRDMLWLMNEKSSFCLNKDCDQICKKISEELIFCREKEDFYENLWKLIEESAILKNLAYKSTEDIVEEIRDYLEENYMHEISFLSLSEQYHFTQAYLTKIFKKYIHKTPAKFLSDLRTQKAKQLLKEYPELSVQQIASMVGYEEQHYFCRFFKNNTGYTPTEYRNEIGHSAE